MRSIWANSFVLIGPIVLLSCQGASEEVSTENADDGIEMIVGDESEFSREGNEESEAQTAPAGISAPSSDPCSGGASVPDGDPDIRGVHLRMTKEAARQRLECLGFSTRRSRGGFVFAQRKYSDRTEYWNIEAAGFEPLRVYRIRRWIEYKTQTVLSSETLTAAAEKYGLADTSWSGSVRRYYAVAHTNDDNGVWTGDTSTPTNWDCYRNQDRVDCDAMIVVETKNWSSDSPFVAMVAFNLFDRGYARSLQASGAQQAQEARAQETRRRVEAAKGNVPEM